MAQRHWLTYTICSVAVRFSKRRPVYFEYHHFFQFDYSLHGYGRFTRLLVFAIGVLDTDSLKQVLNDIKVHFQRYKVETNTV